MRREIEIVRLQQIQEQLRQIRHLNRQQMQLLRNFHHDVWHIYDVGAFCLGYWALY